MPHSVLIPAPVKMVSLLLDKRRRKPLDFFFKKIIYIYMLTSLVKKDKYRNNNLCSKSWYSLWISSLWGGSASGTIFLSLRNLGGAFNSFPKEPPGIETRHVVLTNRLHPLNSITKFPLDRSGWHMVNMSEKKKENLWNTLTHCI